MQLSALVGRLGFLKRLDRLVPVLFVLSLALVCFIGGAYVAEFDLPIYQTTLKPSFQGLRAMYEEREFDQKLQGWYKARDKKTGIVAYDHDRAYDGLTLFASFGDGCGARLVTMDGEVVHKWKLPFRTVWPEPSHVPTPVSEDRIHWWRVRMFPNGDLLANCAGIGDTPNGYGLVKIDKDSKLIWQYSDCTHHDFDLDEQGQVFALVHSIRDKVVKAAPHLRTPLLEDYVVVLSPNGEELSRVSIFDAFARSNFRDYLEGLRSDSRGDHTHANTIDVIGEEFAAKHKYCSVGDVMISLRNPGLLAIMNLKRKKIVWAGKGTWERQHDSDPLANGNIMLFDNRGGQGDGGKSRVLEWNPRSGAIEWSYSGTRKHPLETITRGCQQLLPNGNLLVTESNNGRLIELTRDQKIVWEFRNPDRMGARNEKVAVIFNAERYDRNKLTFLSAAADGESNPDSPRTASKDSKANLK
jgi:hypothetical protein